MTKRPNILFVMADQMAPAFLPMHGHPVVKTPHLSALAERGIVFDSAYCPSPLCAPSRFSMMAGRRPAGIGAYDNAADFAADIPTFAHYLRQAGYRTILSGKMHFCGPDQLHGFEERLTTDIYPADYGWTPDWDHPHERPDWYHNMSSVTQAGLCVRTNQLDFDDEVTFTSERALYENTVVLFLSDHGEMLGERGLWFKMTYFEGGARVPLVISAPQKFAPRRVAASVSLVDVLPTLVDLAGGDSSTLGSIDGRSLL